MDLSDLASSSIMLLNNHFDDIEHDLNCGFDAEYVEDYIHDYDVDDDKIVIYHITAMSGVKKCVLLNFILCVF